MRALLVLAILLALQGTAYAFSYATGGCATAGCAEGESWLYTNANEVDAALDALESIVADGDKGDLTLSSSGAVWNIDTGAVGANEIADNSIGAGDIGPNAVANSEMADDAIGPAEMADADHGDVAWSGGVASVQAGTATTAGALAANGANCSAGNFPLGVDASGAAESCTDVVLPSEVSAYTTGTSTPVDGSTACNTGDMHLETDAFKIYFCTDGATDKWYGVSLSDTP